MRSSGRSTSNVVLQWVIEKARQLTMPIRQLERDLYCIDQDFRLFGVRLGGRTTVVRMLDGSLVLHAPGPLTDADVSAIDALGPVRTLLAPNLSHHLFLATAHRRWPEAQLLAPAALQAKRRDLPFDIGIDGACPSRNLPPTFRGTLEPAFVSGIPNLDEIAFYHVPSRTLILTDIVFNMRPPQPWWTRSFMRLNGAWDSFRPPRVITSMLESRKLLRDSMDAILALDFDRVVVAHGEVLERGGRAALRDAYCWLAGGGN